MKVVKQIKRDKNAEYFINPAGEIFEVKQQIKKVGEIKKKKDKHYEIRANGDVVEIDVVKIKMSEYAKKRESGEIKKLIKSGVKIEIVPDEDATLKELTEIEVENIRNMLVGKTIKDVSITYHSNGSKTLEFKLEGGGKIKLKDGLLAGSKSVEVEM